MRLKLTGEYLESVKAVQRYKEKSFALLGLQAGQNVLDVGCGTGSDALELAHLVGCAGRVVGIDNDPEMIQFAQEKTKASDLPLEFRLEDAHNISFADGTFDVVRTDRSLQHMKDPFQVLAEMCRVTKPGGVIVETEPDWGTLVLNSDDYETTTEIL